MRTAIPRARFVTSQVAIAAIASSTAAASPFASPFWWQARGCAAEGAFDGIEIGRTRARTAASTSAGLSSSASSSPVAHHLPPRSTSLNTSAIPPLPEPYDLHNDLIEVVFNPLTGHTVRTTSPQMKALASIGVAPVNGDLTVVDPIALRVFHRAAAEDELRATQGWPRRMKEVVVAIAQTATEQSFPDVFTKRLTEIVNQRAQSRIAAAVVGELRPEDIHVPAVLKEGQQRVLDLAVLGHHLYIGGTAGTGKTDVLRSVRKALMQQGLRVGTTATTGLAAANLGGVTYHSLLGVTRTGEVRKLSTLATLDVLIIDEVSMMDKTTFEKLELVLRRERNDPRPFGGMQLILCGDFLQLEAIPQKTEKKGSQLQFIFESNVFADNFVKVMLTEQVRQADNPEFSDGLRQLRRGVWPDAFDSMIKIVPSDQAPAEDEMLLFCRKDDVNRVNAEKMAQLPGRSVTFEPVPQVPTLAGAWTDSMLLLVTSEFNEEQFVGAIFSAMAQKFPRFSIRDIVAYKYLSDGFVVRVRLGQELDAAQVAGHKTRFAELMRNVDTLSSGTAVTVPRTQSADTLVPFDVETALSATVDAHPVAQRQELKVGARVMLRHNLTANLVNGSTGMIVDFVEANSDRMPAAVRQNTWFAAVLDTYIQRSQFQLGSELPLLPLVQFPSFAEPIVVPPVPIVVGGDALTHYYELSAINVPLVPAYASTTHKAQGLTLNCRVRVYLERMWKCNHIVYVALSRVRRADQLSISGFDKNKILVNPKAVDFDQLIPHAVDTRVDADTVAGSNWFAIDRVPSAHATATSSSTSPVLAKRDAAEREKQDAAKLSSKASNNMAPVMRKVLKRSNASDKSTQDRRAAAAAGLMLSRPSFARPKVPAAPQQ